MSQTAQWYCVQQRAGPLVKECRALRPRVSAEDTAEAHRVKAELKKRQRCAVNRSQTDRLELRLALFGWTGEHYTLTFDDAHLPPSFAGVRLELRAFLARWRRWRDGRPLDYIYAVEGLHGDHRYHVHFVADYYELSPVEVRQLWRGGLVDDEPVLLDKRGYRRLAEYLNKERTDGVVIPIGRHPWSCSRSLNAKLPPPVRWTDDSGIVTVPDEVLCARKDARETDWGAYYYASYVQQDDSRACARVCARCGVRNARNSVENL